MICHLEERMIYMGIHMKSTTAGNLQKAINDNLVTIISAKSQSKDGDSEKIITKDQFKDNLDFYMESGIFADTLDFKYMIHENNLTVDIGFMSSFCDVCITVEMVVNDGVAVKDFEKVFRKVSRSGTTLNFS